MHRLHRRLTTGDYQVNAAAIWRTMLERLESAPIDEVSKAWLQTAHLMDTPNLGADDIDAASFAPQDQAMYFTLQVPGSLARDIISTRWRRSIEDILADITGQPVAISVTAHGDDAFSEQDTLNGHDMHTHDAFSHNDADINYAYYDIPPKSAIHPETRNDPRYVTPGGRLPSDSSEEWDNEQRANMLMHNRLNPRYTFD